MAKRGPKTKLDKQRREKPKRGRKLGKEFFWAKDVNREIFNEREVIEIAENFIENEGMSIKKSVLQALGIVCARAVNLYYCFKDVRVEPLSNKNKDIKDTWDAYYRKIDSNIDLMGNFKTKDLASWYEGMGDYNSKEVWVDGYENKIVRRIIARISRKRQKKSVS